MKIKQCIGILFLLTIFSLFAEPRFDDKGIINDVHGKYVGQIVWANQKIDFRNPDESSFKTSFEFGEYIYGRFYLNQSMQNTIYEKTGEEHDRFYFYYDVYLNGQLLDYRIDSYLHEDDLLRRTSQQVWIHIDDTRDNFDYGGWLRIFNALPPGTHTIKADLRAKTPRGKAFNTIFASGSFSITKKAGESLKWGNTYSDFKAGMENSELESQILTCINSVKDNMDWDEVFYKVKIASNEWHEVRDRNTNELIEKYVIAYCFASWPNGDHTVQQFSFKKYFDGVVFNGVIGDSQEKIDPE